MMLLTSRPHRRPSLKRSLRLEPKHRLSPIPEERSCHDWHDFQERQLRGRSTLQRSPFLDALATHHAQRMASELCVMHSAHDIEELQQHLGSTRAGENVQRGEHPVQMHEFAMHHHPINRSNMLSDCFNEFGVGVATGSDGYLYVCQMFRGVSRCVVE